jgi:hypothetical protein
MEGQNNSTSRFNVVIRIRPEVGEENTEIMTEEDLSICCTKVVSGYKL